MKIILFLFRYSQRLVILAVIAGAISGACNTGLLALINAALTGGSFPAKLVPSFIVLCLMVGVSRVASELLLTHLGQAALINLRMQLSRKILSVPLRKLEELGAHRLMASLTDDVPNITGVVTTVPILCINAALVVSCLIYLGWLSWPVLLLVLGCMALGIVSYQIPVMRAMRYARLAREAADALYNHFRALTEGIKELKLHGERREAFLSQSMQATAESLRRSNIAGMTVFTLASTWGQLLIFVVIGVLLLAMPALTGVTARTLTGYTLVILYMMTPLQVIMNALPTLGRANVALKKVEDLGLALDSYSTEGKALPAISSEPVWERLELIGVTHAYHREGEDSDFILGPINLTINRGETIFIVGGNGSGKTTLAKLLMGLYVPESGEIQMDRHPVTDDTREHYRRLFSAVFSDFFLFESLLGLNSPQLDSRAEEYLNRLQLSHKVQIKDGAFSTTELSQGQRKRLALLTAYLEDRSIYLFDEWAADQDVYFKEIFYLHLLPELKSRGKTVIVISHDDRYYHVGDRLIKLEEGKLSCDQQIAFPQEVPDSFVIAHGQ